MPNIFIKIAQFIEIKMTKRIEIIIVYTYVRHPHRLHQTRRLEQPPRLPRHTHPFRRLSPVGDSRLPREYSIMYRNM